MKEFNIIKKFDNCTIICDRKITIDYKYQSKYCSDIICTTRLVIDEINDDLAYARVYWSSADNIVRRDNKGNWILGIDQNYEKIIIDWYNDFDEEYIKSLILDLLDKEKVSNYLDVKNDEYKYIGGIRKIDGKYQKVFDENIVKTKLYKKTLS